MYKIFNGKYDEEVTSWLRSRHSINSVFTSLKYIVIFKKLTLLTELSHFGIVSQKLLFVLELMVCLSNIYYMPTMADCSFEVPFQYDY